jgi:glutathione S-transferase
MRLYGSPDPAPNPRRVRIMMAEKGVALPEVPIDLRKREHRSDAHLARNSLGQVPVLELDDGTTLSESVSICRYLDALHPDPPMFGTSAIDSARVDMWIRRSEFRVMTPVGNFWRHAHPLTARIVEQHREFGESNRAAAATAMAWLDHELGDGRAFLAGDAFTMADIVLLTIVDFAEFIGLTPLRGVERVAAWHSRVSSRPSARA